MRIPARPEILNVHVDMDNLWVYERDYGIPPSNAYSLLYEQALPDLLEVFKEHGVKATFFAIGKDFEEAGCRRFCASAASLGHEIANHTYSHAVHLHRMTFKEKEYEIKKCEDLISETTNQKPVGFRGPAYYLDEEILELLLKLGYRYDTSVLPSYANHLMHFYMRRNGSVRLDKVFGRSRYFFASRHLRRIELSRCPGRCLYEIPITTMPLLRMPIHPTFIYKFGLGYFRLARRLLDAVSGPYVYLFHAIDLLRYPPDTRIGRSVPALTWPYEKRLDLVRTILVSFAGNSAVTSAEMVNDLCKENIPKSRLLSYGMRSLRA